MIPVSSSVTVRPRNDGPASMATSLPSGTLAGGSSQTASIGAAIIAATDALTKELLKLAGNDSPLAGLTPEEVEARDGMLMQMRRTGSMGELCLDIAARQTRRGDL